MSGHLELYYDAVRGADGCYVVDDDDPEKRIELMIRGWTKNVGVDGPPTIDLHLFDLRVEETRQPGPADNRT